MRTILKAFRYLLLFLVLALVTVLLLLQTETVQTFMAQRLAAWLSEKVGCTVMVERIGVKWEGSLFVKNLYISDQRNDTLLFLQEASVSGLRPLKENEPILIESFDINGFVMNYRYPPNDTTSNLDFLLDFFQSENTVDDTSSFAMRIGKINLINGRFRYDDNSYPKITDPAIDWNHLDVSKISLLLKDVNMANGTVEALNMDLMCAEKSGFQLSGFHCAPRLESNRIGLNETSIGFNQSRILGDLEFTFSSYEDFLDFNNAVVMDHVMDDCQVLLSDLSFFSQELKGFNRVVQLKTRALGTLNDLQLQKTEFTTGNETRFLADMSIENLDDPDSTKYRIYFSQLHTSMEELGTIEIAPFDSVVVSRLDIPESLMSLGKVRYTGEFTGTYDSFQLFGELKTDIGILKTSIQLSASGKDVLYEGTVSAFDADLGKFYRNEMLGKVSCDLKLIGSGIELEDLAMEIDMDISSIEFSSYAIKNISAVGNYQHRNFDGKMKIDDPNVQLTFDGLIDFQDTLPVLDFALQLENCNPSVFGIVSDTALSSFSGDVKMRSIGLDYKVFSGFIDLKDLHYCSRNGEYDIQEIKIASSRVGIPVITLNSDLVDGRISGNFVIDEIPLSLMDIASHIIPSFHPLIRPHKSQEFALQFVIKDAEPLTSIFMPELHLSKGSFIKADVSEMEARFECTLSSSMMSYSNYSVTDWVMDIQRPDENVYLTFSSAAMSLSKGVELQGMGLDVRINRDTLNTSLTWRQENLSHAGDVNGRLILLNNGALKFDFDESQIKVFENSFLLNNESSIVWSDGKLEVVDFSMKSLKQQLKVNGVASGSPDDTLNLQLSNIDLQLFQDQISHGDSIRGLLDMELSIHRALSNPYFSANIRCQGFSYNQTEFGDILFDALWMDEMEALRMDGSLSSNLSVGIGKRFVPLSFSGYFYPNRKEQLDVSANVTALKLQTLNAFLPEESIELEGTARGTLSIGGSLDAPKIHSKLFLERSSVYIDYLNTKYFFSSYLNVLPDMITMDNIVITDEEGHQGLLTGQLLHSNYAKWNFDLMLDFSKPMLLLNTVEQADEAFFGKAYGTGYLGISGDARSLSYEAQLRTERGTYLGFPMGSSSEEAFDSFISFKPKNDSISIVEKKDLSGLKLNLGIDITSDAKFEVIFDKSVGDVMSGNGKGHIDLGIDQFSNLSMTGGIDLLAGNYKFTLKNLINKDFVITPGGRIDWTGDPLAGNLDIKAVYKVPASLYDLLNDPQYQGGQRVPVNLGLALKGAMLNPLIDFDIELPSVDQMTRSRVNAVLSSDQERNRQAFALLMLRRFVSPPSVTADHSSTSALSANGTELLSSQISNWLGQISNDFDLGFNYNPGDDISNEEIALALSTQFFNDRLILSSNLGVSRNNSNSANQNTSNLIGDVRVEYKITPSGKVRLVMYNESNDYRMASTQQSPYTQGLGVIYREDFDNMQQLIEGLKRMLKGRPKNESDS